jgi:hypothetical protein
VRAIEFRHRKTVLKSCLTAVRMLQSQVHADYVAEMLPLQRPLHLPRGASFTRQRSVRRSA